MRFPRLFVSLMGQFEWWIQGTLGVARRHVFNPNFMLLRPRQQSYQEAPPTPADVALAVEVAGSSIRRGAGVTLPIYAKHGIPEYWIADLDREALIIHRQPSGGACADVREFCGDATVAPLEAPGCAIAVRDVFA